MILKSAIKNCCQNIISSFGLWWPRLSLHYRPFRRILNVMTRTVVGKFVLHGQYYSQIVLHWLPLSPQDSGPYAILLRVMISKYHICPAEATYTYVYVTDSSVERMWHPTWTAVYHGSPCGFKHSQPLAWCLWYGYPCCFSETRPPSAWRAAPHTSIICCWPRGRPEKFFSDT